MADRRWKKSIRSVGADNCVEVNVDLDAVRDSKNSSAALVGEIRALVRAVKSGQIGR